MDKLKRSSHQHGTLARESIRHEPDPYWKRAHHDWRMWVGLFFMFTAITIYVMSNDLTFFGFRHRQAQASDGRGR